MGLSFCLYPWLDQCRKDMEEPVIPAMGPVGVIEEDSPGQDHR